MLLKGFLRHKTPENIMRKDVEFSTPFHLFSIGLIYSWRVAPQQSSFTLQSNKAKISNLNYIYNLSKLVTTYPKLIAKTNFFIIFIYKMTDHYFLSFCFLANSGYNNFLVFGSTISGFNPSILSAGKNV